MGTYDQMIVDSRYPGEFDSDKDLLSKPSDLQEEALNTDDDKLGFYGRRVYLESPSFGNKEEEDMYRYVSSRLTDRTSVIDPAVPATSGAALMDSLDFELDVIGTNDARSQLLHTKDTSSVKSQGHFPNSLTTIPRADPRQDPLIGPLLAELDAMASQQSTKPPASSTSIYRRNSLPYQSSFVRPTASSQPNHVLTNIANRTVNDALLEAELFNSFDPHDQQPRPTNSYSPSKINLSNYPQTQQQQPPPLPSRVPNMDTTDLFLRSSSYNAEPASFLSYFGSEDQLFQKPSLNALGQNYAPSSRPPPSQPYDPTFDQPYTHISPAQRTSFARPHLPTNNINNQPLPPQPVHSVPFNQQHTNTVQEHQKFSPQQRYEEQFTRQINPSNNHESFFTDNKDPQFDQPSLPPSLLPPPSQQQQQPSSINSQRSNDQQDQESKRQAIWSELVRTSAKAQEKNAKKRESPNRGKSTFGSTSTLNSLGNQQPSNLFKPPLPPRPFHHPPPITKTNHIEENIDMIKNKENFYHRSPARKYENLFLEKKELHNPNANETGRHEQEPKTQSPSSTNHPRHSSLPVTINLNNGDNPQSGPLPASVTIPLDSHLTRDGDKISLNIDLRLVDFQNYKQQQQQQQQQAQELPQWSSLDPLDRHIRKLERNIDQSLPPTSPPQRNPVIPSTGVSPPTNRYSKTGGVTNRSGYNPPVYGGDFYGDRGREEDSYLSKLNYSKKNAQFKPYTGRDYEQFKKNYGFGIGHLGFDFDNTNHREKMEKLTKTKEYAQQVEARNRKKLTDASRRTLSDTRIRPEPSKPSRFSANGPLSTRIKQFSGLSTYSSPATMDEALPYIPAHRPTEVLYRPPPIQRQILRLKQSEYNRIIEHLNWKNEGDNFPRQPTTSSTQTKRESSVESNQRHIRSVEGSEVGRTPPRRFSPMKQLPPIRPNNNNNNENNKRRPIRFDKPLLPDKPTNSPPQKAHSTLEQQPTNADINQPEIKNGDEKMVIDLVRQEVNEQSPNNNKELVVAEQNSDV